jgi:hypothetical protein
MPVSKQRKNQKKKSLARTSKLKDDAKRISKKFLENYRKIMEAKNQSENSETEE